MHRLTAPGQWAVLLLLCTASLLRGIAVELLQCTATPLGDGGDWNFCNALPAMHCRTASGQWAVQFLQCTASLPGGSEAVQLLQCTATSPGGGGQWDSCNTLPPCLGAVGSATPAMRCHTGWGRWAVELLRCTASLPGGNGRCYSCYALPHCSGAVGNGTPAMHCRAA